MSYISFTLERKCGILSNLQVDILCFQETHKDTTSPKIRGVHLIVHHEHPKHGSAIYAGDKSIITASLDLSFEDMEILRVETSQMTISSVYKPPTKAFAWPQFVNPDNRPMITIGDFNSHSNLWGYDQNDSNGDIVENWAASNDYTILHSPKEKPTFMSAHWKKGYNPDLAFVSSRYFSTFERTVEDPIPKSQHRPVTLSTKPAVKTMESNQIPRFNFRKAKWENFTKNIDNKMASIEADPKNYEAFQKLAWEVAKKKIPRGCRKSYIPCLNDRSKEIYETYIDSYNKDPFSDKTVHLGEDLILLLVTERSERLKELITSTDMTHGNKKAWKIIKKLKSEKHTQARVAAVTPNQVANH